MKLERKQQQTKNIQPTVAKTIGNAIQGYTSNSKVSWHKTTDHGQEGGISTPMSTPPRDKNLMVSMHS